MVTTAYHEGPATPIVTPTLRKRTVTLQLTEPAEPLGPIWTYPGMGSAHEVAAPEDKVQAIREELEKPLHAQLGEWPATAICGNDILSSVLYSSGIVAVKAGKLMPVPLMLVAVVLYFFRFIYEEVVTAIPLNGGSYNVLLNTTSKRFAAFGAALGVISYLATGVVSATSAINYLGTQVALSVLPWTVLLLFAFAALNLVGIAESAVVAVVIFFFHVATLSLLTVASFVYTVQHPHVFRANMDTELPAVEFAGRTVDSCVFVAIFFGFGAAMLGITGFESSAQFVEEQAPGVFRKTLRNMWAFASVFNTALAFMALGVLPLGTIVAKKDTVLAEMGRIAGGTWLETWVAVDAFVVLSGAVLTSYVGITGLVRRLAFDRVLPAFLMQQNACRGTNHSIILLYFVLASSLVLLLDADTSTLSGVYSYAFLGLMALFAFGCMALKAKRAEIPRAVYAPWWTCLTGFALVVVGLLAILLGDPKILVYFAVYLLVIGAVMAVMLQRVVLLRVALVVMKKLFPSRAHSAERGSRERLSTSTSSTGGTPNAPVREQALLSQTRTGACGGRTITKAIIDIKLAPIVYFCKHPDMTILNKAILYVRKNELTHNLRIVHVADGDSAACDDDDGESGGGGGGAQSAVAARLREFEDIVALFDAIYPKLKLDFVSVRGRFEPAVVKWLAATMDVAINMMFIAQPGDHSVHRVATLGVRVITGIRTNICNDAGVGAVVLLMLERVRLLQALLFASRTVLLRLKHGRRRRDGDSQQQHTTAGAAAASGRTATSASGRRLDTFVGSVLVAKAIETIKKTPVVFFCKAPNLPKINEAVAYVLRNEQTYCLCLVHVREQDVASPREFEDIVCLFDHIYPLLKIDFVSVTGAFDPATVEWISQSMGVPTNMMFMRQPASLAIHAVAALGVRVITN
ncbi:hypothetical protein PybrP1_013022 [[Pythium] brassicae (nom. inval.)]|nr:hypothetical protein PybrP1_013022 [[Pythium] brassicae (nom. inval.)]